MARPEIEPRMRRMMRSRMGMEDAPPAAGDNPVAEDREPAAEERSETPAQEKAEGDEGGNAPFIFAPKEAMGGKQWKAGDEVVFKIKSIDPETGEAQLYYAPEKPSEEPADSMDAMEAKMPEGNPDQGGPPAAAGGGY